jgi:Trk K+ transport system NAD-binding subunit
MSFLRIFIAHLLLTRSRRENLVTLGEMVVLGLVLVGLFTALFHHFMADEGRSFSLVSGLYWTFTVMTTLGFGDITFVEDGGRAFSVVVMITGVVFQTVLIPFTVINFLWEPMMEVRRRTRTPRQVPAALSGHVLLTRYGEEDAPFLAKLRARNIPYRVMVSDLERAAQLHDQGLEVVVGGLDEPDTYRNAGIARAALVVANHGDAANAMIAATALEACEDARLVATADSAAAAAVLSQAGCERVIIPAEAVGQAMARRVLLGAAPQVVGRLGGVLVAEAQIAGSPWAGRRLDQLDLARNGVQVIGRWDHGRLSDPDPAVPLDGDGVLVLAGPEAAIAALGAGAAPASAGAPVLVIGGGRVGRAVVAALEARGVPSVVVERSTPHDSPVLRRVVGDATNEEVLREAGIDQAPAALVTTHSDDLNVFLTLRLRLLRPDLQVVARASAERNVSSLYRVGAAAVVSYPSILGNQLFNMLHRGQVLLIAEGLAAARVPVPATLAGMRLADSGIRAGTGCTVVGFESAGLSNLMPGAGDPLPERGRLLLTGTMAAMDRWFARYGAIADEGAGSVTMSIPAPRR